MAVGGLDNLVSFFRNASRTLLADEIGTLSACIDHHRLACFNQHYQTPLQRCHSTRTKRPAPADFHIRLVSSGEETRYQEGGGT